MRNGCYQLNEEVDDVKQIVFCMRPFSVLDRIITNSSVLCHQYGITIFEITCPILTLNGMLFYFKFVST